MGCGFKKSFGLWRNPSYREVRPVWPWDEYQEICFEGKKQSKDGLLKMPLITCFSGLDQPESSLREPPERRPLAKGKPQVELIQRYDMDKNSSNSWNMESDWKTKTLDMSDQLVLCPCFPFLIFLKYLFLSVGPFGPCIRASGAQLAFWQAAWKISQLPGAKMTDLLYVIIFELLSIPTKKMAHTMVRAVLTSPTYALFVALASQASDLCDGLVRFLVYALFVS